MSGSFTLTGKLTHHDKVTPHVDAPVQIRAAVYADSGDATVYSQGADEITDAEGTFSVDLLTETDLYYTVTSASVPPLFSAVTFLAPTDGHVVDLSSLVTTNPGAITPSLITQAQAAATAAAASATDAAASAASINREAINGVAGLDGTGKLFDIRLPDRLRTGQVGREYMSVADSWISVKHPAFAVVGDGVADDTAAINAAFAAAATATGVFSATTEAFVPAGTYKISTLNIPAGVLVRLAPGANLQPTSATASAVTMGAAATLTGGKITSPASWDGTNISGPFTYAVVFSAADDVTVDGVTLVNVPKVGIGMSKNRGAIISRCRITGNYPAAQWTGVETGHFGIAWDGADTYPFDSITVIGNHVRGCVQGTMVTFHGASTGPVNANITGNSYAECWNHGVYGYGHAHNVSNNTFNRCGIPVALQGEYHVVSTNTMYIDSTFVGGTDARDECGISMRDSSHCEVTNNTLRGNGFVGAVVINVTQNSGTDVSNNLVANNTVDVAGVGIAIRVGSGATTCKNNKVKGNIVNGQGTSGQGLITITSTGTSYGNDIEGNTVVIQGITHGIYVSNSQTARVAGNTVRLEYNAASAVTIGCVTIASDATGVNVTGNQFECPSSYGTNVTLRGVYEVSGGAGNNRATNNSYVGMSSALATVQPLSLQGTAASYVDEVGTGVPTSFKAKIGSMWHRTDGGAGTALYVNETGLSSGWVGK